MKFLHKIYKNFFIIFFMPSQDNNIEFLKQIEEKWQKIWEEKRIFEPEINKSKKKFFITIAFPYMNGKPHLGHLFSFARAEFHARLRRLQGFNVLYPQGWHCTGSPIVANALMVKEKNPKIFKILEMLGVPKEEWSKFENPEHWINYFKPYWKETFKKAGFSIDWRREFITTYLNPYFSKFVEWQYLTLKEKGLIYKGKHAVVWCPKEKKIVGDHDRKDEYAGIQPEEVVIIKFIGEVDGKRVVFPTTTYRPETVFGVENLWLNPNTTYYLVKKEEEYWILSNLDLQEELKFEIVKEINGKDLINKKVINPVTKEEVLILPAEFVKPDFGTGVVMSVPAHAPYDYIALVDLGIKPKMKFLIETEGKKNLVEEVIKSLGIKSQKDKELLEKATKEVYKKEFHKGIFLIDPYKGLKVSEAKEKVTDDLIKENKAEKIYILPQEVICRCGAKCVVNIVENQWFIKYSDPKWKELAHKCVEEMRFWPKDVKETFHRVIDWLNDWAISHDAKKELGTPLPWDKSQVIESLSDSTIYMAYYVLARFLEPNSKDFIGVRPEQLTKEFFDFVLLGKGKIEEVSEKTGIKKEILEKIKEECEYWYPLNARHSGKDLIQNHLTFFIFHHTAIFDEKKWPKGIAVNGHVLLDGEKMSKSKGNIIPTDWALENWGADISRFLVASAGDSTLDDGNLDTRVVERLKIELPKLIEEIPVLYKEDSQQKNEIIEKAFLAYYKNKLEEIIKQLDELNFRTVIAEGYYKLFKEIKQYLDYLSDENKKKVIEEWLKIISIFVPHTAEEIWQRLGKSNLISQETFNFNFEVDEKYGFAISYIEDLAENIRKIKKLIEKKGGKVNKVEIFLPTKENYEIAKWLNKKLEENKNFKEILDDVKKEKPEWLKEIKKIQKLLKNPGYLKLDEKEEEVIKGFKEILAQKVELEVEIKGSNPESLPGNLRFNLV